MRIVAAVTMLALAQPAWTRHIWENQVVAEISQEAQAVGALDRELASPATTLERRAAARSDRDARVENITGLAARHALSPDINKAAAESLLSVREPVRAVVAAERAVMAAPQDPDSYLQRARANLELGRYGDAVKDFERTLRLRPGDPAATAGLKLSVGRASSAAPTSAFSGPPPAAIQATEAPAVKHPSEFDRRVLETANRQKRAFEHYTYAQAAQASGDWDKALSEAERAVAISPNDIFLKDHLATVRAARQEAERPKPAPPAQSTRLVAPKKLGASSFIRGFTHYLGRSAKPRRIEFKELDTSDVRAMDFPEVAAELDKPARNETIKIKSSRRWTAKGQQWLLVGTVRLTLRGDLTVRDDCRWEFYGALRSKDDYYDFDAAARGTIGEALTAIGRRMPGRDYDLEIRGFKVIEETGRIKNCR